MTERHTHMMLSRNTVYLSDPAHSSTAYDWWVLILKATCALGLVKKILCIIMRKVKAGVSNAPAAASGQM